jgi:molybdenum cofactor biosynthesis protein B
MSETARRHKESAPPKLCFNIYVCSTSRYHQLQKKTRVDDVSGDLIVKMLKDAGHSVGLKKILPDDKTKIGEAVKETIRSEVDAAIFCGGTGITSRDITVESVMPFLEKVLPGFGEIFRRLSFEQIGSPAVLSRVIAGVARGKAFFCIPGSPDAVRLGVERLILPEAPHIVKHARE